VDQRAGRVFVSTGQGPWPSTTPAWVRVLDGRTGRLLHTVAVGRGPAALAVDESSGHVFVVNSYGTPASPGSLSRLVAWGRPWLPAWGRSWLSRLAPSPLPLRTLRGTVTVIDPSRL
jgi:DNA-binding beta-propeller fold protein YncE